MDKDSRALFTQKNVLVLIYDRKLRLDSVDRIFVLLGNVEKLISDEKLDLIALFKDISLIGAGAIDLDFFQTYGFI